MKRLNVFCDKLGRFTLFAHSFPVENVITFSALLSFLLWYFFGGGLNFTFFREFIKFKYFLPVFYGSIFMVV